jgi:cation diffusion facilitator family transporter
MSTEPAPTDGGHRSVIAAFLANLGIAIAKLIGFLATGAASMAAEAVHSVADTGNQGLLLFGERRARRRPTSEHPFGYGRERYFWSFVVAVVLFTAGGLFALFEALEKLWHPHELESPAWAIAILGVAFVLEAMSLRTAVRASRHDKGPGSWWRFIRESKQAELPVVLLEDTGALTGIVFALTGIILASVTGNARFDALGSMAIGILLVAIALTLATEMKSLLIGEAAPAEQIAAIRHAIEADRHVARLLDLRTQQLAPEDTLVAARVQLDDNLAGRDVVDVLKAIEDRIHEVAPEAHTIYLQPDAPPDGAVV